MLDSINEDLGVSDGNLFQCNSHLIGIKCRLYVLNIRTNLQEIGPSSHFHRTLRRLNTKRRTCTEMIQLSRRCITRITPNIVVRSQSSVNRKDLIPLVKFLHPDLLAQYSERVRLQNITCIQNLNDMWDTMETNIEACERYEGNKSFDIRAPFRKEYDLTCFLRMPKRSSSDGGSSDALYKTTFVLKVPETMCKKQTITTKNFASGLDIILLQQGKLFDTAGLKNPWLERLAAAAEAAEEERSAAERRDIAPSEVAASKEEEAGVLQALTGHMFDRLVLKNTKYSGLRAESNRVPSSRSNFSGSSNSSDYERMFSGGVGKVRYDRSNASSDLVFGGNRRGGRVSSRRSETRRYFEDEVDAFLRKGNVMVLPMPVQDEFAAVQRLRLCLLDYGDVLNFSIDRWHRVVVLLHQEQPLLQQKHQEQQSAASESGVNQTASTATAAVTGKSKKYAQVGAAEGYTVEQKSNVYILRVPFDFKMRNLLQFAGRNLPAAQISMK